VTLRNRSAVVLIKNEKVALMKRIRDSAIYFVFPGGGIEEGETPEDGEKREALEELGVEINVNECISEVEYNGTQYFFRSEIISGTFGTGQGDEFTENTRDRGTYLPVWVNINKLQSIDVRPKEVALKIQSLFNDDGES
jgi:8-oxo-dGTP diphosphatase